MLSRSKRPAALAFGDDVDSWYALLAVKLHQFSLVRQPMPTDNSCLFHSILDQLHSLEPPRAIEHNHNNHCATLRVQMCNLMEDPQLHDRMRMRSCHSHVHSANLTLAQIWLNDGGDTDRVDIELFGEALAAEAAAHGRGWTLSEWCRKMRTLHPHARTARACSPCHTNKPTSLSYFNFLLREASR